jgi:hypothetical protein
MNIEDELRAALRREDPSPGFAQRVVARTGSKPTPRWAMPRLIWASAIAAMVVVGFAGMSEYREKKAERAGHEAVLALQIAAEKLNMTRDKVVRREN